MPDWREHIRQVLTELAIDPAREEEVVAELVQHLDDRYGACVAAGGSDDEARRTALDELADARLLVAELMHAKKRQPPLAAIQDSRGGMLSGLWRDLRYGFRMIRRHPGFSSVAVLTLALGIAANGAVFSVIHAVLLQELPYTRPGELVMVWESRPREGIDDNVVSPADFLDWRARQRVFTSMAAAVPTTLTLSGAGEPEQLSASSVSAAFFSVLGVVPILGRDFTVEEEQAGRHRVVMLTHGLWQRRFAGTPDIVGTRITLSGEPYEVIGVLPASFRYGEQDVSVFSPIDFSTEDMRARFNHFLRVLARLKPGTTVAQAQENMDAISAQIQSEVELQNQGHGASVIALREQLVGDVRSSLLILMAAVAFVLLIACVNIANLLLARGASRAREVALRSALGAGRFLIARQVVMECVALAACSALVAVPVAAWSVGTLQSFVPADIPRLNNAGLNVSVIAFMVAIALLTGLFFSLAPALQITRLNPNDALKEGAPSAGQFRPRVRRTLVVTEIALAFVLLVGAGLMMRSLVNLFNVDAGFDSENVLTVPLALPRTSSPESTAVFFRELLVRLRARPAVAEAGFTTHLPMSGDDSRSGLGVEGRERDPREGPVRAHWRIATPGYFAAMRLRLTQGRLPTEDETARRAPVAVINRTAAQRYWAGQNPIGRRLRILTPEWREIVGVVDDVRHWGPSAEVNPEVYLPGVRNPTQLVVRTSSDAAGVAGAIREEIRQLSPELPLSQMRTMDSVRGGAVASPRFYLILLGLFASVAFVLAVVGVYGVTSYTVAQSRTDIGIRMALGARGRDVVRQFVHEGLALTSLGVVIGAAGAYAVTRLLTALLFGVTPTDAPTFAGIATLMVAVAATAVYVPARRAANVDPLVALRRE